MTLGIRKVIVLGLVIVVFLMANALLVASWLADKGVIDFAKNIRTEYLTGTAITIVVVLLILLVNPAKATTRAALLRRCPVCDKVLVGMAKYCGDCGSKI